MFGECLFANTANAMFAMSSHGTGCSGRRQKVLVDTFRLSFNTVLHESEQSTVCPSSELFVSSAVASRHEYACSRCQLFNIKWTVAERKSHNCHTKWKSDGAPMFQQCFGYTRRATWTTTSFELANKFTGSIARGTCVFGEWGKRQWRPAEKLMRNTCAVQCRRRTSRCQNYYSCTSVEN